jgi:hypothetical protein
MPTTPHQEASMPPKPTIAQLNYLRALASRTGQTFTYPRTRAQASAEIARLKQVPASSQIERELERLDLASEQAAREANCDVPIDLAEVTGYVTATWSQHA